MLRLNNSRCFTVLVNLAPVDAGRAWDSIHILVIIIHDFICFKSCYPVRFQTPGRCTRTVTDAVLFWLILVSVCLFVAFIIFYCFVLFCWGGGGLFVVVVVVSFWAFISGVGIRGGRLVDSILFFRLKRSNGSVILHLHTVHKYHEIFTFSVCLNAPKAYQHQRR